VCIFNTRYGGFDKRVPCMEELQSNAGPGGDARGLRPICLYPGATDADSWDIRGYCRPSGTGYDIGAIEEDSTGTTGCSSKAACTDPLPPCTISAPGGGGTPPAGTATPTPNATQTAMATAGTQRPTAPRSPSNTRPPQPTATRTRAPTNTRGPCIGDCNSSGATAPCEFRCALSLALDPAANCTSLCESPHPRISTCASADCSGNGEVDIDEVYTAFQNVFAESRSECDTSCPSAGSMTVQGTVTDTTNLGAGSIVRMMFAQSDGPAVAGLQFDVSLDPTYFDGLFCELVEISTHKLKEGRPVRTMAGKQHVRFFIHDADFDRPIDTRSQPPLENLPGGSGWVSCRLMTRLGSIPDGSGPDLVDVIGTTASGGRLDAAVSLSREIPTPTPVVPLSCVADCNTDGEVTVDELVRAVNIAIGNQPLGTCPQADFTGEDSRPDDNVDVAELVRGVRSTLFGCETPTPPPASGGGSSSTPAPTPQTTILRSPRMRLSVSPNNACTFNEEGEATVEFMLAPR